MTIDLYFQMKTLHSTKKAFVKNLFSAILMQIFSEIGKTYILNGAAFTQIQRAGLWFPAISGEACGHQMWPF